MAITKDDLYSSKIFLNAALPLAKVIAMDIPKLGDKFKKTHAVIQVSAWIRTARRERLAPTSSSTAANGLFMPAG